MSLRRPCETRVAALPSAPDDRERILYVNPSNRLLSVTQLISWVGLSLALFLFSLNSVWLAPFTAWVILGVAYFTLSIRRQLHLQAVRLAAHDALVAQFADADPPSVDVFLPNCGEDVQVLDNTFRHVADLDHAGEVTVYCLDDAGRPAVEELAHRYGFVYLSRPNKGVQEGGQSALCLAGVYAASAVLVVRPLGETVYREIAPAPAVAQADRVPVGPPAFSPSPVMTASPIEKPSIDP